MEEPHHVYMSRELMERRLSAPASLFRLSSDVAGLKRKELPLWGSIKRFCPPIYDQGSIGSCTANAFCTAYRLLSTKLQTEDKDWEPSRLYLYFKERLVENPDHDPSQLIDSGADVTDGASFAKQFGVCSEELWPYLTEKYNEVPPEECDEDAFAHRIQDYYKVPRGRALIKSLEGLIFKGIPVLVAVNVYGSLESSHTSATGVITLPNPISWYDPKDPRDRYLGGHEMCIVGYSRDKQLFTVANSWGTRWGDKGFGYLPYDYVNHPCLGIDFTVIVIN